jgi:hypothetical protein
VSGQFSITLDRRDYVSAYWLYLRDRWLWRRLIIAYAIVFAIYFALFVVLEAWDWGFYLSRVPYHLGEAAVYSAIVTGAVVLISIIFLPRRLGRLFDQLRMGNRETTFEFDQQGLRTSNRDATTTYSWDRFSRCIENRRFVLLLLAEGVFIVIPRASVDAETLAALIATLEGATARKAVRVAGESRFGQ